MNKIDELIRALGDSSYYVQIKAAETLGNIGGAPAVEPLIRALGDNNSDVRKGAVEVLGKIGAPAVEPLIKALGVNNSDVRGRAALALGRIGGVRAVELLIRALGDSYSYVREKAAEALVNIGMPAVEPLINTLGDTDLHIRKIVVEVLGRIGNVCAVEPLIRSLRDENADVRSKVVETLEKLMWKPKTEIERAYYHVAKKEWDYAVSLGLASIEPLIRVISDSDSDVQRSAFEVLSKIFPQIIEIIFGEFPSNNSRTSVKDIDVSQLTIPMSNLTKITISADTYDFDMVERFITYAINYVGQKQLKKKVEVYISGNPDKLHPNLLNSLNNLCRKVIFYK